MRIAIGLALVAALCISRNEAAATPRVLWSQAPVGCLPGGTNYSINGSSITSNSGTFLALFCPVTLIAPATACKPNSWQLSFAYSASAGSIQAFPKLYPFLLKVSRSTGVETIVANPSGISFGASSSYAVNNLLFAGTLDFENYVYYVQLQLYGSTPGYPSQITVYWTSIDCDV